MAAIDLPQNCTHPDLLKAIGDKNLFEEDWEKLVLRIPKDCFVSSSAIAFLASWGLMCCEEGKQLKFIGDQDTQRYLSRMDLFECIGYEFEETFNRHSELGRFIPVKLVAEDKDVLAGSNAICDLILRTFDNGREFIPAIEWAVYELVDNIHLHSETPVPGALCAQFYPKRHRIDIGICDVGRGIKASLGKILEPWESHGSAIAKAVERGVTRDKSIGQGNGLAGSLEIANLNKGKFMLWSGNANFAAEGGQDKGYQQIPFVPGTGLFLSLDTRKPVDLADTFIGESTWGYIDVLGEEISEAGKIILREECVNFGTRNSAKSLRRKIEAVLPDLDTQLVIDFFGVEQTSSSFLDELIGRLVQSNGVQEFNEKIKVINATERIMNMLNVVIHQRIGD